jgi:hypothetical protein
MSRARAALALLAAIGAALALSAPAGARTVIAHLTFFESPSRNIGCVILDGVARCDIVHRSWSPPPRPASCPNVVDFGQGLTVSRLGSAGLVCAGDTALDPKAPTLAYGAVDVVGPLHCASAVTGITCHSTLTGHGFFISRQRYSLF